MAFAEPKTTPRRRTIGIFADRVERAWGSEFMSGVADAAEANDINLICFVGGKPKALLAPEESAPSYGLYDLVKPGSVDGLILAADLGHGVKPDDIRQFCQTFAPLPIVTQAIESGCGPSLQADSINGMRAIIKHLIEDHNHRRIAFIRGPKGQVEAEQRFQAYRSELEAHNIRFDERLVVQGDFSLESGREAARILLEDRKVRTDAIAASNDRMAFGVMDVLEARGVQVPGEIAVTGFDDVNEAQLLGVPLTTVRQNFYECGRQAVFNLLRVISGEKLTTSVVMPSSLVIRWSCGCLPESVRNAVVGPKEVAQTGQLENKREAAIRSLLSVTGISDDSPSAEELSQIFGQTWDTFLSCLKEETHSDEFLKSIEQIIYSLQKQSLDATIWHNVISVLRRYALGGINDTTRALRAENLFQQARMLAGELSQRAQAYRRLVFEQQEGMMQGFGFSMAPAMSLNEIGAAIARHFPTMGIQRWYVMFYSDVSSPESTLTPPPQSYRMLMQYDETGFTIPTDQPALVTGRLIPRGKLPETRRFSAVVMPLTLARNRFGFMWTETGPRDWEVYLRVRNLVSSALLRTMLVEQREQAQSDVERLLQEVQRRADELSVAKEIAEKTASENARLYQSEQSRREQAEALARASRYLSSLLEVEDLPQQILEQLRQLIHFERGSLLMEELGGTISVVAQNGFPNDRRANELRIQVYSGDVYDQIATSGEALCIDDVTQSAHWQQVDWLPVHHSWLGVPLFSKDKVIGMLSLTRKEPAAFTQDDQLLVTTFAMQAAIALDNARLYKEVTRFSEMMERMVEQRVDELSSAYDTLAKLDQNKTSFIAMAAHELRTPLTVMKGYLGMLRGTPAIQDNEMLSQAVEGVMTGTNRLHSVVNSMLDVARLEGEVLRPQVEPVPLHITLRLIQKEYQDDLAERNLEMVLDESLRSAPFLLADPELFQKALDHVIVNAIKYTPDGGTITISCSLVDDNRQGRMVDIHVQDTGIGIDPANHKIIFEKLYSLGKVELHSSGRTKFKGGGPGLGLAIVAGIVKAHNGRIWVESPGHDEEKFPGSTFIIRWPVFKD